MKYRADSCRSYVTRLLENLEARTLLAASLSREFGDFSDSQQYSIHGITQIEQDFVRLTDSTTGRSGAIWSSDRIATVGPDGVRSSFQVEFKYQAQRHLLENGPLVGPDGFSLMFNGGDRLVPGAGGSSMGYRRLGQARALEFDFIEGGAADPRTNHIGFHGNPFSTFNDLTPEMDLADGTPRYVRVVYNGIAGRLDAWVSDSEDFAQVPTFSTDFDATSLGESIRLGFIGATSGHAWRDGEIYIDDWSFQGELPLPPSRSGRTIVDFQTFDGTLSGLEVDPGVSTVEGSLILPGQTSVRLEDAISLGGGDLIRTGSGFETTLHSAPLDEGVLTWRLSGSADPNGSVEVAITPVGQQWSLELNVPGNPDLSSSKMLDRYPEVISVDYDPLTLALGIYVTPVVDSDDLLTLSAQIDLNGELGATAQMSLSFDAAATVDPASIYCWSVAEREPIEGAIYRFVSPETDSNIRFGTNALVSDGRLVASTSSSEQNAVYVFDVATRSLSYEIPQGLSPGLLTDGATLGLRTSWVTDQSIDRLYQVVFYDLNTGTRHPHAFTSSLFYYPRSNYSTGLAHSVDLYEGEAAIGGLDNLGVWLWDGAVFVVDPVTGSGRRFVGLDFEGIEEVTSARLGDRFVLMNGRPTSFIVSRDLLFDNSLSNPIPVFPVSKPELISFEPGALAPRGRPIQGSLGFIGDVYRGYNVYDLDEQHLLTTLSPDGMFTLFGNVAIDVDRGIARIGGRYFDLENRISEPEPIDFDGIQAETDGRYAVIREPGLHHLRRDAGGILLYDLDELFFTPGDLDGNGRLDITDLDLIWQAVRDGTEDMSLVDVIPDGVINDLDVRYWIQDLFGTSLGDLNLDGTVDLVDLNMIGESFGHPSSSYSSGDLNVDGVVDLLDLDLFGRDWSNVGSAFAASFVHQASGFVFSDRSSDLLNVDSDELIEDRLGILSSRGLENRH